MLQVSTIITGELCSLFLTRRELAGRQAAKTGPSFVAVAHSKQVCIEWIEATVLFCKDCLEGKGDLYSPASCLAFAGDALARFTRDVLPALLALLTAKASWRATTEIYSLIDVHSNTEMMNEV